MKKLQIGNQIKAIREANGVSREELAHRVGVATTTVYRWEKGQQAPKFTDVLSVSNALNVSMGEFSGEANADAKVQPIDTKAILEAMARHSHLIELIAQMPEDHPMFGEFQYEMEMELKEMREKALAQKA